MPYRLKLSSDYRVKWCVKRTLYTPVLEVQLLAVHPPYFADRCFYTWNYRRLDFHHCVRHWDPKFNDLCLSGIERILNAKMESRPYGWRTKCKVLQHCGERRESCCERLWVIRKRFQETSLVVLTINAKNECFKWCCRDPIDDQIPFINSCVWYEYRSACNMIIPVTDAGGSPP